MPKQKLTLYLEPEHVEWLESQVDEEQKVSTVVRNLIRKAMKLKSKRKTIKVDDFFNTPSLAPQFVPDDLKEYTDLLVEWWTIRYKNKGTCSRTVFDRIIKTLRSFPSQDRKEALEKAITGGWKDIYPLKKSYKPEEPEFKPRYFKASDNDLPPTLAEMGKTAKELMEGQL
ncbi:MAG: hypothetical protein MK084_06140 [Prochlorococcus sp. ALOHA_A2.0_50]|nr:hypothetical protein [Prochlorococcus sp. ALOHA_A2.0_50]